MTDAARSRLDVLLDELDRALAYTDSLWLDLTDEQRDWRPHDHASAIGWHLGHQAAVAHAMVRNLLAAEPLLDPPLDALMDSATPEPERGALPDRERLLRYRTASFGRVRARVGDVRDGRVGAPEQLAVVASVLLTALVNHEYQHDRWVGEVRAEAFGLDVPPPPRSPRLVEIDGSTVLA